jgi:cell division topological specificity factor
MSGWLDRFGSNNTNSASKAKERLKLVLINDRTDLSPEELDSLKNDLLSVISRYIEIDPQAIHIQMTQEGREQRLVAEIPLKANLHRKR